MNNLKKYLETKNIIGNWQSKRLILDRLNGSKALFLGKMSISPETEISIESGQGFKHKLISLNLREEGTLTIKNKTYQFSQEYLLNLSKDRCDVLFNNKSLFFSINRLAESQGINHSCKSDQYFGKINFVNESSFLLSFNILGPQKEYFLKVLYKR